MIKNYEPPKSEPIKTVKSKKLNKIYLDTILDLMKNGPGAGIEVINEDSDCRIVRAIELENARIEITEWSEWKIRIIVFVKDMNLVVYESPGLEVNWSEERIRWADPIERFREFPNESLIVQWDEKGEWCYYIADKIDELALKIEEKRAADKERKKEAQLNREQVNKNKKNYFNDLFKAKN